VLILIGHLGMNKKILYSIIIVAFVGGMFTVAYAGPIMPTITLAGTVDMVNNQITDPQDATTKFYVDSLFSCEGGAQMCSVGVGECIRDGINICVSGVAQCGVVPGSPSTETCDGLDNDCDGSIDEDDVCSVCGNNVIESGEDCDGTDLGGQTCANFGFNHGPLFCQVTCIIGSNLCSNCGNGIVEGTEVCDDGNFNNSDDCTNSCLPGS